MSSTAPAPAPVITTQAPESARDDQLRIVLGPFKVPPGSEWGFSSRLLRGVELEELLVDEAEGLSIDSVTLIRHGGGGDAATSLHRDTPATPCPRLAGSARVRLDSRAMPYDLLAVQITNRSDIERSVTASVIGTYTSEAAAPAPASAPASAPGSAPGSMKP